MTDPVTPHPSPHRFRLGFFPLCIGLFGAPFAWLIQVALSQSLSAHACYPLQAPLAMPQWQGLTDTLAAVSAGCFCIGVFSGAVAWTCWHKVKHEKRETGKVVEVGEGRTRFLAALAILTSLLFVIAVLFTTCALLLVSPCRPWF